MINKLWVTLCSRKIYKVHEVVKQICYLTYFKSIVNYWHRIQMCLKCHSCSLCVNLNWRVIWQWQVAVVKMDEKVRDRVNILNKHRDKRIKLQKKLEELRTKYDEQTKDAEEAAMTDAGESAAAQVRNNYQPVFWIIHTGHLPRIA